MGRYHITKVGIFIKIPVKREIIQKVVIVDDNGIITSNKFNPDTGERNPTLTVDKEITTTPSQYPNFSDGLDEDTFVFPEYLPKTDDYSVGLVNYDYDYEFEYDGYGSLNYLNVKEKINQFKLEYKPYLDYFTKEFGDVEVHYGVTHYEC